MKKLLLPSIFILCLLGLLDALYLTYDHYSGTIPPCTPGILIDCGKVLQSKWSVFFGIPVAVFGAILYFFELLSVLLYWYLKKSYFKKLLLFLSFWGLIASFYFMFIQFFVIVSICLYCTLSALICLSVFILLWKNYGKNRKYVATALSAFMYKHVLKSVLFRIDPEVVHETMVNFGSLLSKMPAAKYLFEFFFLVKEKRLEQEIAGITFKSPVGLSAGFDYDAKLTQILPSLSFGFMSVGTITNSSYEGNPRPRLGRLPKSKSLMVNKGFKSIGVDAVIEKLRGLKFKIPVGISVGRTNSSYLNTQNKSIADIVTSFEKLKKSKLTNAYYELNISCPNLIHAGNIDFYEPKKLSQLLKAVDKLDLKRPVFVKMPIDKTDKETESMLRVISRHKIVGVIFGNLQKNKNHPSIRPEEAAKYNIGNFSGKPTWQRSNELISLAYQKYGKRFVIIGCGGIFNSDDAYEKIKRGASLVQLITGMIFEGPQLISRINLEIANRLREDGLENVADAVGIYNR